MKITLDYTINAVVDVDTATGKVTRVALNGEDFIGTERPEGFFNPEDSSEPEYLRADHPEAVKALEIASGIRILDGYVEVRFEEYAPVPAAEA